METFGHARCGGRRGVACNLPPARPVSRKDRCPLFLIVRLAGGSNAGVGSFKLAVGECVGLPWSEMIFGNKSFPPGGWPDRGGLGAWICQTVASPHRSHAACDMGWLQGHDSNPGEFGHPNRADAEH
jgi:hypothetical protein